MLARVNENKKKQKIITPAKKTKTSQKKVYAVLPLTDFIIFPKMVVPFIIDREKSIKVIEAVLEDKYKLVVLAQQKPTVDYPETEEDLYTVGTSIEIMQAIRFPNNTMKILIEGMQRVKVKEFIQKDPFFTTNVTVINEKYQPNEEVTAMVKFINSEFNSYIQLAGKGLQDIIGPLPPVDDPGKLADMIITYLPLLLPDKQSILEEFDPIRRLEKIGQLLSKEIEYSKIETKLNERMRFTVEKTQKEYFLRQKIKSIKEELGEDSEWDSDVDEYREKISKTPLPEIAKEKVDKELQRLEKMPSISAESAVIRNYIDLILEMPWDKISNETIDLKKAKNILEADHYGMDKAKERILEYLAVKHLKPKDTKGTSILCMVGPPGVGKTSLARSIARSMDRKFERIALGGVGDDSEIRGHRRTYIGSMPGRIIEAIRKSGTKNPVILLDEIDKLTKHYHGDPSSALLEVLDPEQNMAFTDHFLDLPFDLSKVFFICAANTTQSIVKPLLDRMEMTELSGYTEKEKIMIAKNYLIPRQVIRNGLTAKQLTIKVNCIKEIIRGYTREAGVRELERLIGKIGRKVARLIVEKEIKSQKVDSIETINKFLGPVIFTPDPVDKENQVGVVYGLAWTDTGGSVLPIEVSLSNGKGKINLTGRLGEVMKESAQIALAYLKVNASKLKIDEKSFTRKDVFLHVPEGAVPKDGPSAGIALTMSMLSAFTNKPFPAKYAITGEVSLKGRVLRIGGLKEKSLAAHRYGIRDIIIPYENMADIDEFPDELKNDVKFWPAKNIDDVMDILRKK